MAEIASFRGILPERSRPDLARLATASVAELGRELAAGLASGALVADPYRAIYRVATNAPLDGRTRVRRGFLAAVRLGAGGDARIVGHQRSLPPVREAQLAIARATSTQLAPATALYADAGGEVERVLKAFEARPPALDVTTADGVRHVLWRIQDAEAIGKVRRAMAPKKLLVVDGQHRYEAMLARRAELEAATGGLSPYASAQYGLMLLCNQADDGLALGPRHRLLRGLAGFDPAVLLARAREHFVIEPVPGAAHDPAAVRRALEDVPGHQPAIVVAVPGSPDGWRLTLDPHVDPASYGVTGHPLVIRTDVVLLHGLVLDRILGLDGAAQDAGAHLGYPVDIAGAQAALPGHQAAFFLGPVTVDGVRRIAELGDSLPARATTLVPRAASGLCAAAIDPDVDLG